MKGLNYLQSLSNVVTTRLTMALETRLAEKERKKERKIIRSLTNVVSSRLTKALERLKLKARGKGPVQQELA